MTPEIKERIDQIRNGIVPEGYKRIKDALVPAEWSTYKISDFATINQGFTFSRDFQGNSNDEWNYFKVADIGLNSNSRYLTKALNTISEDTMHQIGCVPFKAGSIVFPRVGAALLNNNKKILAQDSIVDDNVLVLSVTNANICVNEFIYYVLQNMRLKSWCNSGLVPVISAKIVYKYILYLPPIREQQKIAEILSAQDKVIELEQQKIEEIIKEKRFFLEKMFPKKVETEPEIRFKGFTDPWEQRKFDEMFDCTIPSNTLSRAELSYDEGTVLNVHYGDVLIKYGAVLDVQKDEIPRIPQKSRDDFKGALLQDGDVIIADTAEDETTGKACEVGNLQGSALVSGLHTMVCRPRSQMAPGFFGYYLNSGSYHRQLLPLMQGIKVLSLSRSNIQKTVVSYPAKVGEQQLIADYFGHLDHLITLHQRKLEEEKKKKKALMQLLLTGIARVSI